MTLNKTILGSVFMEIVFETERITLKILDKLHADLVLDYYLRNKDFLKEWEPLRNKEFYTIGIQESLLEENFLGFMCGNLVQLWVFKKNYDNKIIGSVTFNNIIGGNFSSCYLAYNIDKDEINQGYITEAAQKGIDIVFNEYKLHRIQANIMPKNNASLRVVEKLGFHKEGLAHKYLEINGEWEDHIYMALLNDKV
jgi:ribosomal-protein-alanine N-acetyltransferase